MLNISKEKTRSILAINGIKIPLLEHQQVLIQQIIDSILRGTIQIPGFTVRNKNIWIKSDIGTGKSLIFIALVQYFKNLEFQGLLTKIPYKADIFAGMEQNPTYYQSTYNQDYVNHEILKTTGFHILGQRYIKEISFPSFQRQAILFVQNQVVSQFEEYINTQSSLTYKTIDSNKDLILFMLEDVEQDIILWNTDKVDVQQAIINITTHIRENFNNLKDSQVLEKVEQIKKFYTIDEQYSFNKFWIQHMNNRQRKPFAFVAFDDFDTLHMDSCQRIPSLVDVFIGTTMIQTNQQSVNTCSSFIFNNFIKRIANFRILPEQLQQILHLPKIHAKELICETPSNMYSQYKILEYICKQFRLYRTVVSVLNKKKVEQFEIPNENDYKSLLIGKKTAARLFREYLNPFQLTNDIDFCIGNYIEIIYQMYLIFKVNQSRNILDAIKDTKENAEKRKQYNEKINDYQMRMISDVDNTFIKTIAFDTKQNKNVEHEFSKQSSVFDIDLKHMKTLEIVDNGQYISDACITSCCGMIFNFGNIPNSIVVCSSVYTCSYCKKQISSPEKHIFHIFEEKNGSRKAPEYVNISDYKFQVIETPNQITFQHKSKHWKVNEIIQENRNKKFILYLIEHQQFSSGQIKLDDFQFEKSEQIIEYVMKNKPIGFSEYAAKQDYSQYKKEQEYQLQYMVRFLSQKYKEKFFEIKKAFVELQKIYIQPIPDVIIVKSLKNITGENMTYVDDFIFYNIPESKDEYLQIVGRSNRIGRNGDNTTYLLYYPKQDRIQLNLEE